jgi:Protein of unknown function (DUF3987)
MAQRRLKASWIATLSTAINAVSEAPMQYSIWAAIAVIGSVLKDRVYIKHGIYDIRPNQYIVFVGPPGIGKGSSIHPAYDFPKRLNLINVISDRITAPRIIERFASGFTGQPQIQGGHLTMPSDSTATLISAELPTLLTSSDWMLQFLCDAWDRGEYDYDTKNAGSSTIRGMCTSLVGACVPEYIRRLNKDATAAINGGFTARTIFVYAEEKSKKLPWPKQFRTSANQQLLNCLDEDLTQISQMRGEFQVTQQARWTFDKWYYANNVADNDSDVTVHFKSRMHVHILKLAMAFSAAEKDDLVIDDIIMQNSILCMEHILGNLDKAFRGVGESELSEATNRVQNYFERKGYASKRDLLSVMHRHVTAENLGRILDSLCYIRYLTETEVAGMKMYSHTKTKTVISTDPSMLKEH